MDAIVLSHVISEISFLIGARLDRIKQQDSKTILLSLRMQGKVHHLLVSIDSVLPAFFLAPDKDIQLPKATNFLLLLRKYLQGGKLISLAQPEGERMVIMTFTKTSEIGDLRTLRLIVELMGRHSNICLLNENNVIMDALLHIDSSQNRHREIMPARPYIAPPPQNRLLPSKWQAMSPALRQSFCEDINHSADLEKTYASKLAGMSPLVARSLLASSLSCYEQLELFYGLWQKPVVACFYAVPSSNLTFVHVAGLPCLQTIERASSFSLLLASEWYGKRNLSALTKAKRELTSEITKLISRTEKKLKHHLDDQLEGEYAETYRINGELLLPYAETISPGQTEIEVVDYYSSFPDATRTIKLNPKIKSKKQSDWYFKRYRKATEKAKFSQKQLNDDRLYLDYLQSMLVAVYNAETTDDTDASAAEWQDFNAKRKLEMMTKPTIDVNQESLKSRLNPGKPGSKTKRKFNPSNQHSNLKNNRKSPKQVAPISLPRQYKTPTGYSIFVGRNNLQNEQLVFKKGTATDLWFHIKNQPGPHVLLKTNGMSPDNMTIEMAAKLAAYFAKSNKLNLSTSAEVDYCEIKNVKKQRGGRPGQVIYDNYQTALVSASFPKELLEPNADA